MVQQPMQFLNIRGLWLLAWFTRACTYIHDGCNVALSLDCNGEKKSTAHVPVATLHQTHSSNETSMDVCSRLSERLLTWAQNRQRFTKDSTGLKIPYRTKLNDSIPPTSHVPPLVNHTDPYLLNSFHILRREDELPEDSPDRESFEADSVLPDVISTALGCGASILD